MRRILLVFIGLAVLNPMVIAQTSQKQLADEVIAITKAEWAAQMRKDVAAQMKNVAEDCTEFAGAFPTRLDGKAIITRLRETSASGSRSVVMAEMANEKVQVYGDVAILTYNAIFFTKDKDGEVRPDRAKSTRVYVKQGGQWWLVHAHFSPQN